MTVLSRKTLVSKVASVKKRIQEHRKSSVLGTLKKRSPLFLYLLWLSVGTVFYACHEEYPFHVALYQSTSVGWAIGWELPEDKTNTDGVDWGTVYSCFHNLVGVLFVGVIVLYIEIVVSRTTDNWMVEMTNRQGIEYDLPANHIDRLMRWIKSHKDTLKIYAICSGCCLLCILCGYFMIESFTFAEASDMTLSTLSCGGYQGIPVEENKWNFIFLALFTNIAVPLFLVAAGTLASFMITNQNEKSFYKKIASPMSNIELKYMQYFGIENGDGALDKKEFLILIIIRIGNIKPRNVLDIHTHYDQLTAHTGGQLSYAAIKGEDELIQLQQDDTLMVLRKAFRQVSSLSFWSDEGVDRDDDIEEEPIPEPGKVDLNKRTKTPLPKISSLFRNSLKDCKETSKIVPVTVKTTDEKEEAVLYGEEDLEDDKDISTNSNFSRESTSNLDENCAGSERVIVGDVTSPAVPHPLKPKSLFASPTSDNALSKVAPLMKSSINDNEEKESPGPISNAGKTKIHPSPPISSDSTVPVRREVLPSDSSQNAFAEQNNVNTYVNACKGKPNPFVLMRQFSRQESNEVENIDKLPTKLNTLKFLKSSSTASSGSFEVEDFRPAQSATIPSTSNYSKSGRKKFSSQSDRQSSSFERTMEMLGRSKEMVMRFVVRTRQRKHKNMLRRSTVFGLKKISEAHNALEKEQSFDRMLADDTKLCTALGLLVMDWCRDSYFQAFLFWISWLLVGGIFYSINMNMSLLRGFYMSVNVGYAIYWTTEEDSTSTKAFSVVHVIFGQLITTVAMAFFAGRLKQPWYAEAEEKNKLNVVNENSHFAHYIFTRLCFFVKRNHVHCLSILWLIFGVVWSLFAIEWSFMDSLYFSITSLSTGGIWSIPEDSSDLHYFVVAVFTCTGAPLLCLSAGIFAYTLCQLSNEIDFIDAMQSPVTIEELEMMKLLDINDNDGYVDITEYVVLILIRIKAVKPELIAAVLAHFNSIDENKEGSFSYDKLLAPTSKPKNNVKTVLKSIVKHVVVSLDSHDADE